MRPIHIVLLLAVAMLISTAAFAQGRGSLAEAQATYKQDRAACMRGEGGQDRATCLKEAAAALQEAKRGGLTSNRTEQKRNQTVRCDYQPAHDRADCLRRMRGEGTTTGSVQGGGVLRELTVPVSPQRN
jgi:hypothetical protein